MHVMVRVVDDRELDEESIARGARVIDRNPVALPDDALQALEREARTPLHAAYRTQAPPTRVQRTWLAIAVNPATAGRDALLWPALRTAVPAGASATLFGSLFALASTLHPLGIVGTALGGVLGAYIARTQYRSEREQTALAGLWLAASGDSVLVGRYDSLSDRIHNRVHYYRVPIEQLARDPATHPPAQQVKITPGDDGDALVLGSWRRWHARVRLIGDALDALGVSASTVDSTTAERVYVLARLGRLRRGKNRDQ